MAEAFLSGGIVMWPLLLIGLTVVFLAGRTGLTLRHAAPSAPEVESRLRALLFWGGMGLVLGVLGTTVGIVQMAQAIGLARAVQATTIWGGLGVSLVTLVFGLVIFLLSAVLWFTLDRWHASRASGGGAVPGASGGRGG